MQQHILNHETCAHNFGDNKINLHCIQIYGVSNAIHKQIWGTVKKKTAFYQICLRKCDFFLLFKNTALFLCLNL